jgi:hypothetical protein
MMIEEMILTTVLLGWLFFRFARQDEERQALLDLAAEHGYELSDERAARAARAGRGAALRERILAGSGEAHDAGGNGGPTADGDASGGGPNGGQNPNHAKEPDGQLAGPDSSR